MTFVTAADDGSATLVDGVGKVLGVGFYINTFFSRYAPDPIEAVISKDWALKCLVTRISYTRLQKKIPNI